MATTYVWIVSNLDHEDGGEPVIWPFVTEKKAKALTKTLVKGLWNTLRDEMWDSRAEFNAALKKELEEIDRSGPRSYYDSLYNMGDERQITLTRYRAR